MAAVKYSIKKVRGLWRVHSFGLVVGCFDTWPEAVDYVATLYQRPELAG